MQQKVLSPLGVEVADLSLRHLHADSIEKLRRLLADHGMVVLRGQEIDDAEFFIAFLVRFGDLTFTPGIAAW